MRTSRVRFCTLAVLVVVFWQCRFAVWFAFWLQIQRPPVPKKVSGPVKGGTGSRTRSAGSGATEHRTGEDSRRSPRPCWHGIATRPTGVRGVGSTAIEKHPHGRGASVVQHPLPIRRGLGFGATPQAGIFGLISALSGRVGLVTYPQGKWHFPMFLMFLLVSKRFFHTEIM